MKRTITLIAVTAIVVTSVFIAMPKASMADAAGEQQIQDTQIITIKTQVTNDPYADKQWALSFIQNLPIGRNETDIIVAVLDTGIDANHEDLAGKVIDSVNFTKSQTASDVKGHGTHIAGIITANANNSIGVAGAAANVKLLNVRIADDKGMVWPSAVAKGIIWAVDNGARIINMSLAVPTTSPAVEEAVDYAWSKGVVLIAASGNNIKSVPVYPAYYPNVIAVAAEDNEGNPWTGSNTGDWVDVYAPGVDIYSTLPGNNYGYLTGTSMATAYVTAIAALTMGTVTDVNGDGRVNGEVASILKTVLHAAN